MAIFISFILLIFIRHDSISANFHNYCINLTIDWQNVIVPHGWELLGVVIISIVILNILFSLTRNIKETSRKKLFVVISIVCSLSLLAFFKYFNFFTDSFIMLIRSLLGARVNIDIIKIALPVGISFYIFKTISYIIDVYRKDAESTDSLLDYATYLAFFPQLLAGPIERARSLIPQLQKQRPALTSRDMQEGAWLFVWGLFKKVVVADNIAVIVNEIFGPYDTLMTSAVIPEDGLRMLVGIYAFTIQIYSDFSGYTDMSRGIARLFGFNTMENFRLPYFSTTAGIFWRRWHISLSTWLRDYLYIPLGGNRCSKLKIYRNIMITMILGGLWHGSSWTFMLWGTYHGILLLIYRFLGLERINESSQTWKKFILGFLTFNLVALGWLFFRAKNMTTVAVFLQSIFTNPFGSAETWNYCLAIIKFSWFLLLFQIIQFRVKNMEPIINWNWFVRLTVWVYLVMTLWIFSQHKVQEFIYFAF